MAKTKSTDFMIRFVRDYLNGENSRLDWDLDFNHYLIQHYPKMARENAEVADCFAFYLSEEGYDRDECPYPMPNTKSSLENNSKNLTPL
jgi:hypothetical protein